MTDAQEAQGQARGTGTEGRPTEGREQETREPETLIWPLFVELMCAPLPQGRALRGTIRTTERELWFASSGGGHTGPPVVVAPLAQEDGGDLTATVQDERLCLDSPSGEPYLIVGRDTAWKFTPGQDRPDADEPSAFRYEGVLMNLVTRPSYDRFIGHDFAKAEGPITATTFLGRPAWELTLKPPSHKPYPLRWIVDAETGTLLRQANVGVGVVAEWTSFEVVDALPEETFTWDGPARTVDDRATEWTTDVARHEQEMAERRARLGLAAPTMMVTAHPDITVHEVDDDGSFTAAMSSPTGYLARQPAADGPRDHHITGHRFHRTWIQGPWRWDLWLFDDVELDDAQLAAFRDSLTPADEG